MSETFNGSLGQSVKLAKGLLEELEHNPPGSGAGFILAAALRKAHRDGMKTILASIHKIEVDEAAKLTHPRNGQWDATATNTAVSVAQLFAQRHKVTIDPI